MATKEQAKFLYFSTNSGYAAAKDSLATGAIAFDAEGQHIYIKADASHSKEYYIGDIVNDCSTDSSTKSLSAAQGKILWDLINGTNGIDSRLSVVETKTTSHDSSIAALDASSADYATRIGAMEVLDTKMQQAIVAVAKACAANELEGADKSVTVTPGSVDASIVDGSIMDGVVKAKIKVNLSGNTIALDDSGLYVNTANLSGIPQAGITGLTSKFEEVDGSIDALQALVGDTSVAVQIKSKVDIEASARALADASLEAKKVDKETGKRLMDDAEGTKLAGIAAGAQVNVVETVKVNGVALTPDASKAVNVVVPAATVTGVKTGDKVLKLDPSTKNLETQITLDYVKQDGSIYLKGLDGTVISSISTQDFIKDGMISDVSIVAGDDEHPVADGPYLVITFNTESGKSPIWLPLKALVDVYTVKDDSSTYLEVTADKKIGAKVEVAHGLAGYDHLTVTDSSLADVSSRFATFESSANTKFTLLDNKNTSQDSSISTLRTDVDKLDGSIGQEGSVKKQIYDASTATESALKGKVTDASDASTIEGAKRYADWARQEAVKDVSISGTVTGDTYISSSISASGKTISGQVGATSALTTAVANANSAIQGVKVNGSALTPDASIVNVTITTGDASGNVKVNGTDVAVKGLQNAAYVTVASLEETMDAKDTAMKNTIIGPEGDASSNLTVRGVKAYAKAEVELATGWYVE